MFDDMTERGFVEFLAALWESRGWETGITERDEGVYMITGDKVDGTRGLMLAVPDPGGTVSGQELQKLATIVGDKGIDTAVAATRGGFSEDAQGIANSEGIHLLDPPALEETVGAEDAHDLVEEYSESGGGGGGSLLDRLPIPAISATEVGGGGPVRLVAVVVLALVIVALAVQLLGLGATVGGLFAGLPIPDLGLGLGGGGYTITAVSLSGGNATPAHVEWNARTQTTLVSPNGEEFSAPDGKQFVVVQVNVTNPANESLIFRADYLALATGNTRYGNQPLQGASGQLPTQVKAESTVSAYVVYTVPADSESATLLGLPGPDVPPMTFERNRDLQFQAAGG